MWDLSRPGLKPVSPALAGGFLTTAPPGKCRRGSLRLRCQTVWFLVRSSWFADNCLLAVCSHGRERERASLFCPFFKKIKLFIYLFIFGCIGSSSLRAGFSLVAASGGYSLLQCMGFSLRWLLLLESTSSRRVGFSSCGLQALERRLRSCGARA